MAENLPDKITAGLTLDHTITLTAYPAPDWDLSVVLRGPQAIDISAVDEGSAHRLTKTAAETGAWAPGSYWFSIRVTDGASVIEVEEGTIEIAPDLAAVTGSYDGRTHPEIVLDAIEAVIEGRATKDQERYRINNRELWRTPVAELLKWRSQYKEEVRRAKAAKKGQSLLGRNVLVRF